MKFGLFLAVWENPDIGLPQKIMLDHVAEYVIEADQLGYESVFLTEHHFTGLPQIPSSLTILANFAARTKRIRLGTGVTILPWHNPLLVLEQAATIDLLSDGRFDFGVGRGFRYSECRGFDVSPEELQARFDEAMEIFKIAWKSEGRFSFKGQYWTINDAMIDPKSIRPPHVPVWVSADSEGSIRRVADQDYNLMLAQFAKAEDVGLKIAAFREQTLAQGRDYDPNRVLVVRSFHIAADEAEAEAARERAERVHANNRKLSVNPDAAQGQVLYRGPGGFNSEAWLVGTKEQLVEKLELLRSVGVEYILLMDVSGDLVSLRTFAREIMPLFATAAVDAVPVLASAG